MMRSSWFPGGTRGLVCLALSLLAVVAAPPPAAGQFDVFGTFVGTRQAIFDGLANQIGTLPNPSGGGFTYQFDPQLGVFNRTTESFGPVFAARAETTGKGKFTLNASFSRHTFDRVDDVSLKNGDILSLQAAIAAPAGSPFPLLFDLVSLREQVKADVYTIGGLYGVTDRIDVGITIPFLNVKVKEDVREVGFFFCNGAITVCTTPQLSGLDFKSNSSEATGLGDIVLRGKYNFLQVPELMGGRMGVAFALDVKLPTGDDGDRKGFTNPRGANILLADISGEQFSLGDPPLGTGIVRVRPQIIASGSWFGFAPHVNVGAELFTTDGITNDFVYEVGFDYTVLQRVTFSADVLGRHSFDVSRPRIQRQNVLLGSTADADTVSVAFGIKANPFGSLLVFLNLLVPITQTGIRDNLTPTFGVEWSF